jgi:Domain of unknown function (DUF6438)
MKVLLTISLLLLVSWTAQANEIDNLKTFDDVNQFLKAKVLPKDFETVILDPSKANTSNLYGKQKFYKLDLDRDGLTDLVVDGAYLLAVMDRGNARYKLSVIDQGSLFMFKYTLKNIETSDQTPVLVIEGQEDEINPRPPAKEKKIVYKFDGFVEFNPKPDKLDVREIDFSTSGCFGSCPIFDLKISANRRAVFNAKAHNKITGRFNGTLDAAAFNRLVDTINYIEIFKLKDAYSVPWTDDQGSSLSITFADGRRVKISDYGMIGTFGLENLYEQLLELRNTVKWNK